MAASSLEQKLSRLEAKLKQENREARRRIDLNLEISPARARPKGGVEEQMQALKVFGENEIGILQSQTALKPEGWREQLIERKPVCLEVSTVEVRSE
ncbi:hypothetical protein JD844_011861 [Phrynosoma platyrhinos]|uniref:Uncharacterized protein n=1 Tax=Phrynosoma platyrhinos TaxID=52577 RepID=A0ABQ7TIQ2_PHRPL|nr:hypothetical protein JD844_011861 [Phrynosoma platyrhinos]